nr:MAG TPA: hypothetical protein [Caudoviricetes sp.]
MNQTLKNSFEVVFMRRHSVKMVIQYLSRW